jgi:enoyl-CoA hydratase/carnithine racemase
VHTLTLNRPDAFNALSESLIAELQDAVLAIGADPDARAVVLAARGRAFCAGHDLREMRATPEQDYYQRLFDQCSAMMLALQQLPVPVIAQVQGLATAAGCQLVAMCDLAVAARSARFAASGIKLGLFCSTPGVALTRNLARKAAFEMLFTGEFIDSGQAQRLGLINRVVDDAQLEGAVEQLVQQIVDKSPAAVRAGKGLFYRQLEHGIEAAYADAARTMACNMMEADALDGVQGFLDRRRPG